MYSGGQSDGTHMAELVKEENLGLAWDRAVSPFWHHIDYM